MLLKYIINSWRSLEMPLVNCKVELKLKWAKYCVLDVAYNDKSNTNRDNIVFTIKDTKLHVPVLTLSAKDNKISKHFRKGCETSVYNNEYKTKSENKNATNEYRYFVKSNFVCFIQTQVVLMSATWHTFLKPKIIKLCQL